MLKIFYEVSRRGLEVRDHTGLDAVDHRLLSAQGNNDQTFRVLELVRAHTRGDPRTVRLHQLRHQQEDLHVAGVHRTRRTPTRHGLSNRRAQAFLQLQQHSVRIDSNSRNNRIDCESKYIDF